MSSQTAKYLIPYALIGDTVASLAATMQNLAARTDLLLGEAGQYSASPGANVTHSQAIVLARTYPGNVGAAVPGFVLLNLPATATSALTWNFWITAWTGTAATITGFQINTSFSAAQAGRLINWRFIPVL